MTRSDGSYPFFFCCKADQTAAEKGDILLLMGTDNRQLSGRLLFDKFDDLSSRVLIQTGKRFIHEDRVKWHRQRPTDGDAPFHSAA